MEVEEPAVEPASSLATLPTTINLFDIFDSGEAAIRDFVVADLRLRQVPSAVLEVITDQSVQFLRDLREAVRGKEGYDGLKFKEDVGKLLDRLVRSFGDP